MEAVGKNVTQFKPGDEVFGAANGAIAEYVCAPERTLVTKPDNVTFEQAGSVAVAGLTALQGLRNQGNIQPGQKVLVNGASAGEIDSRRQRLVEPPGPGFARLTVIDATGAADTVVIRIQ